MGWPKDQTAVGDTALLLSQCTITYQLLPEYLLFSSILIENHFGINVGDHKLTALMAEVPGRI